MIYPIVRQNRYANARNGAACAQGNPDIICSTDLCDYFPVYVIGGDQQYLREYMLPDGERLYHKPKNNLSGHRYSSAHQYDALFDYLRETINPVIWGFTLGGENHRLSVCQGYIADKDDKVLLIVGTNNLKLYDAPRDIDKDQFLKVFVSTELINDPTYKNVYKKIEKDYLQVCYEHDIPVEITSPGKIEQRFFRKSLQHRFSSLEDMKNHLKEIPNILKETERDWGIDENGNSSLDEATNMMDHIISRYSAGVDPVSSSPFTLRSTAQEIDTDTDSIDMFRRLLRETRVSYNWVEPEFNPIEQVTAQPLERHPEIPNIIMNSGRFERIEDISLMTMANWSEYAAHDVLSMHLVGTSPYSFSCRLNSNQISDTVILQFIDRMCELASHAIRAGESRVTTADGRVIMSTPSESIETPENGYSAARARRMDMTYSDARNTVRQGMEYSEEAGPYEAVARPANQYAHLDDNLYFHEDGTVGEIIDTDEINEENLHEYLEYLDVDINLGDGVLTAICESRDISPTVLSQLASSIERIHGVNMIMEIEN